MKPPRWILPLIVCCLGAAPLAAAAEKSAAEVNEGSLVFLDHLPLKPVHHHHNAIQISEGSLDDGWTLLTQCHENLDRVPATQIVFNPERIRNLQVVQTRNIGRAWVEGPSVQLKDVGANAEVCLRADARALRNHGDGTYTLMNGPFMRRFLDGYYPMRVSMSVKLLTQRIRFVGIDPVPQTGFRVWELADGVNYDAWFEGRLFTVIRFATPDGFPVR
ncbi:MAG TPA: hypothetical protein VLW45_06040 [Pelomicrobium sp.]|nr:hypothetical protein [Pelomicrobium sp.]